MAKQFLELQPKSCKFAAWKFAAWKFADWNMVGPFHENTPLVRDFCTSMPTHAPHARQRNGFLVTIRSRVSAVLAACLALCYALLLWKPASPRSAEVARAVAAALRAVPAGPSLPVAEPWTFASLAALASDPASKPTRFRIAGSALAAAPAVTRWRDTAHLVAHGGDASLLTWRQNEPEFVLARGQEARFERSRGLSQRNLSLAQFWAAAAAGAAPRPDRAAPKESALLYHFGPLGGLGETLAAEGAGLAEFLAVSDAPSDLQVASS